VERQVWCFLDAVRVSVLSPDVKPEKFKELTGSVDTVTINMRECVPEVDTSADVPALHILQPRDLLARMGRVGLDLHADTIDSSLLFCLDHKQVQKQLSKACAAIREQSVSVTVHNGPMGTDREPLAVLTGQGMEKNAARREDHCGHLCGTDTYLSLHQGVHGG